MWLTGEPRLRAWAWLPLLLDVGCLPMIALFLFRWLRGSL
jgi:hypothetical protein